MQFIEFLTLPEPIKPSLIDQRLWTEKGCWTLLETKICNVHTCYDEKKKEYVVRKNTKTNFFSVFNDHPIAILINKGISCCL